VFTRHEVVLPAATGGVTCCPPSYSVITMDATRINDHIAMYQKSFTHQSALMPRKMITQELKQKCFVLSVYWIYIRVFLMQEADACYWCIPFLTHAKKHVFCYIYSDSVLFLF
jgi:hypothetical protein